MRNMRTRLLSVLLVPSLLLGLTACDAGKRTAIGAGTGAVVGGATGAIIGHQSGKRTEGALIGAAAGAAIGGGIGYALDRQAKKYREIEDVEVYKVPAEEPTNDPYREPEPAHLMLRLSNEVLFEKGSATLSPQGTQKIAEIAAVLHEYPDNSVIVTGYASSEGEEAYNQDLSQRRANAVANTMVVNKVSSHRIQAIGMGESNPIADNSTEAGRAMNRRVEIEVFPAEEVK